MGSKELNIASQWARAGAMFNVNPAPQSPDLERLLLDTVRVASGNSRLFIMAASWLAKYGDRVSPIKLAELIGSQLEVQYRPVMGLLLSTAQQFAGQERFTLPISACTPAEKSRPLFDIECRNDAAIRRSEKRASMLSLEWKLWAPDFEPKYDAIRPETWIEAENSKFRRA